MAEKELAALFHKCTVRLAVAGKRGYGTGFFVASGEIVTSAHVVQYAKEAHVAIEVYWDNQLSTAEVTHYLPNLDLALLHLSLPLTPSFKSHPCVFLHTEVSPFQQLYSYGYPDVNPAGEPSTFDTIGYTGEQPPQLKFKEGQVRPGQSGSPLLNWQTGGVCGLVQLTLDRNSALGGKACLTETILNTFIELADLQRLFHQQDLRWAACLTSEQRHKLSQSTARPIKPIPVSKPKKIDLVCTITGHPKAVFCVAMSPDGQTLASASNDGTIKIWHMQTEGLYTLLYTIKEQGFDYPYMVTSKRIAISPDGQTLASGYSGNHTIKIWNMHTREVVHILKGHLSFVVCVAYSPDGQTLASGSMDGTIKIWNMPTGELLHSYKAPSHGILGTLFHAAINLGTTMDVYSIAISPDGQTLASGLLDFTIQIWNIGTGELLRILKEHGGQVNSLAIDPGGKTLVSGGSWDKRIIVWDLYTGEALRILKGHSWTVNSVAISPNGQILASGGGDGTIKIWYLHTGELLHTLKEGSGWANCVTFSPDGGLLVSGHGDHTIKVWRIE